MGVKNKVMRERFRYWQPVSGLLTRPNFFGYAPQPLPGMVVNGFRYPTRQLY